MRAMDIQTDAQRWQTDAQRWAAIVRRCANADGRFYYAVRTTGVSRASAPCSSARRAWLSARVLR
jgi:methylphosphotriester-DNA--protein-cysteine methyltransferase